MARLFAEVGEAYIYLVATAVPEVRGVWVRGARLCLRYMCAAVYQCRCMGGVRGYACSHSPGQGPILPCLPPPLLVLAPVEAMLEVTAYPPLPPLPPLQVLAPVEAMLEVTAYPDFSICAMSFNFWHKLGRLLSGERLRPEP